MKYRLKADHIEPTKGVVFPAGTEFAETAPGSGVYENRSRFQFREDAVKNTKFFEPVIEKVSDARFYTAYLPGYTCAVEDQISVSLSQESYEGLPRRVIVNGLEYLHPKLMKGRQEDAFYMARDMIIIPPDYKDRTYRFLNFDEYWGHHRAALKSVGLL